MLKSALIATLLSLAFLPLTALAADIQPLPADLVDRVTVSGLMKGYPDGRFHAESGVSRAELAAIMAKTFEIDKRRPRSPLEDELRDVPPRHWAHDAIATVLRNGVMIGYRPGYFYPNQKVNRAEAYAIFAQSYGVFELNDAEIAGILAEYPDAGKIPAWARKAWATALHEGFVRTRPGNRLSPDAMMTRGDLAYALDRYLARQKSPAADSR